MSAAAIECVDVTKRFGQTVAVRDIDLTIGSGEFFSLLGPSGCGKTTLLRLIAGFEQATSGRILIDGQDVTGVPPHKRPVNLVFQSYALFPHLTVFDNVAFGLRTQQRPAKEEVSSRVRSALALVHLEKLADRFPAQLSGGQQQRVALARAVVRRPSVLLLDEPLSALDLKIRQQMQEELARLQQELGITFIMVTHDQGEAMALSDRIALFHQGRIEQLGSPAEIYEQPKSAFVAGFIGRANLWPGLVVRAAGDFLLVAVKDDRRLWVAAAKERSAAQAGAAVTVWSRPEALSLRRKDEEQGGSAVAEAPSHSSVNWLEAVVATRSYQGTVTDYCLDVVGADMQVRASCPTRESGDFRAGDKVMVGIPAASAAVLPEGEVEAGTAVAAPESDGGARASAGRQGRR